MFRIYVNFKTAVSHKQPSRPVSPTSSRQELVSAEKSVYESQRGKRSSGDGGVSWFRGRSRRTERLRMTGSREHLVLHHVPCTEPSYGHSTPPGRAAALDEGSRLWWTAEQHTRHTHVSTHDLQTTINCTASYNYTVFRKKHPLTVSFISPETPTLTELDAESTDDALCNTSCTTTRTMSYTTCSQNGANLYIILDEDITIGN